MKASRLTKYALLTALALLLSYVESLIPPLTAVPGVKLGLPNVVVVFALYALGARAALLISLLRAVLSALLFGNLMALAYSVAGAALSFAVMLPMQRGGRFSPVGVSIAGAVAHNVAQTGVAMLILETSRLVWYLPPLLLSGIAAGTVIGFAAGVIIKRLTNVKGK